MADEGGLRRLKNSSWTKPTESQIQISSVDFSNLSKQTTNSSHGSSFKSTTSIKNSLSRIFGRRRDLGDTSNRDFNNGKLNYPHEEAGERTKAGTLEDTEDFKDSKKPKISTSSKSALTSQPSTIVSSKAPRVVTSQMHADSPQKMPQKASVQRHAFINRSSLSTGELRSTGFVDSLVSIQNSASVNPKKGTIQLSSQSSNSYVSDSISALAYKFANASCNASSLESTSILELHRRYMTSADVYIQKFSRASSEDTEYPASNLSTDTENDKLGVEFHDEHCNMVLAELFEIIKPILQPTRQDYGSSYSWGSRGYPTVEEAACFVRENLICAKNAVGKSKRDAYHMQNNSKETEKTILGKISTCKETTESEMGLLDPKEFLSKVSEFFTRCCHTLADSFRCNSELKQKVTCDHREPELMAHNRKEESSKLTLSSYLQRWTLIATAWSYFNSRVRFFFLHAFLPTESHFDILFSQDPKFNGEQMLIRLDNVLLQAFRDAFVIPQLRSRLIILSNQVPYEVSTIGKKEISIFTHETSSVASSLTTCLGALSSSRNSYEVDDSQPGDVLFGDFVRGFMVSR